MIDKLSLIAVYPEIILLVMGCVIALVDLGVKSPQRTLTYVLTLITLAVVAALEAAYAIGGETFYGFSKMERYSAHPQREPKQRGGGRPHGRLAQVFCLPGTDGHLRLWPPLCGRSRHAARW